MSLFDRIGNRGGGGGPANPGNKPVCKFYLEGRCRYGDACKNYHPPRDNQLTQSGRDQLPFGLNADHIKSDLTYGDDRPTWPLSAYGPGRAAPRQLLEGPLEQSPEELRVLYYLAKAEGSTQQYEQNERSALDEANQRVQSILRDVNGAIKYVVDGKDHNPNREDEVTKNTPNFNWREKPSFDQSASSASGGSAFGQPSTFGGGGSTSAFGKPSPFGSGKAFGGNTLTGGLASGGEQSGGTSAFGKPSAIGGGSTPFGQPSSLGGGSTAFGKPSTVGAASPFGSQSNATSSPFGQPATNTGTSPFGQTSTNTGASPFGQSSNTTGGSTFGQPSAPGGGTAFGQPSAPGSSTAFGKPSAIGAAACSGAPAFGKPSPFGVQTSTSTSAFGQPSQPGQQQSAFGQPSQSGQQQSTFGQSSAKAQPQSTFGQASQAGQQQSTFGQTAQSAPQQSNFGKPSPFGNSTGGTSTFGQPASGNTSTFGAPSTSTFGRPSSSGQRQSPFNSAGQTTAFGGAGATPNSTGAFGTQQQTPSSATFAGTPVRAPGQPITSFKNQQVTYRDRVPYYRNPTNGKEERIWLPEGAPGPNPDVEASAETYEALGAALKQVYDYVLDHGTFKDGVVPEIPPKREWVSWDL